MQISQALFLAAVCAFCYMVTVGKVFIQIDFFFPKPENRKQAKRNKLLIPQDTPLQNSNLRRNMRKSFEKILIPLSKSDKRLLPDRMDRNFRQRIERQIEQLARKGLCRDIRIGNIEPFPENDFQQWNDDGREWREAVLQCCALERFITLADNKPVKEIYRDSACLRILQSRHIRSTDRTEQKESYYANRFRINCPSCGARIPLSSQQVICPYCGGVIRSDFYDWQTESFELYEELSFAMARILLVAVSTAVLFVSVFLCLWLIRDTQISLAAGVGAACLVLIAVAAVVQGRNVMQKRLAGKINLYSENYLRSCINEALYNEDIHPALLDYSVGTIRLKKVINTEETTTLKAKVYIDETYLPKGEKPYVRKRKRTLILQRARYPAERKNGGDFFEEQDCPSCGANFVPDANNCCSFCGYSLGTINAKWVLRRAQGR